MQEMIEESVEAKPTKKGESDTDCPALAGAGLQVKKYRQRNGSGEAQQPDGGEKAKNPRCDAEGSLPDDSGAFARFFLFAYGPMSS